MQRYPRALRSLTQTLVVSLEQLTEDKIPDIKDNTCIRLMIDI